MPRQQPYMFDPYIPQQSALLNQYKPIHSAGQGFAELAGQLGEAYFEKAAKDKEKGQYEDIVKAYIAASNPNLTQGAGKNAGIVWNEPRAGAEGERPLTEAERANYGMGMLPKDRPDLAMQAIPLMQEAAKAGKPPSFTGTLPKGSTAYVEGKKVAEGAPDVPDIMNDAVFERQKQLRQAGRPTTTVNLPPQQKSYNEARGKDFAAQAATYATSGRKANQRLGQISVLKSALSDPNVYQGTGGPTITGVKRGMKTLLGVDVEGVGPAELAGKVGAEMALNLKENLPGPMSDSDRKFLLDLPPGVATSREGNVLLADYQERVARREIEVATLANQYERENGELDAGFDAVVADYLEKKPLFTDQDYQAVASLASGSAQQKPTAGVPNLINEADQIVLQGMRKR